MNPSLEPRRISEALLKFQGWRKAKGEQAGLADRLFP